MKKTKTKSRFLAILLKFILTVAIVLCMVVLTVALVFAIYVEKKIDKTVDESMFTSIGTGASTKLYYYEFEDRENRIGTVCELSDKELYSAYRCKSTSYDDLSENLINAFICIEDKRFMEHSGVDWKRTAAASVNYFLKFNDSFGGSTITQQLIKNVTENDDYSFQRKLQEIFWALDLEKKFDKKEIITMYLNVINLSNGCFGVGAASEYYFSKDVADLTLAQCASIASITNSPTYYDPIKNPDNNIKRRNLILAQMLSQGYINESEYNEAVSEELITSPPEKDSRTTVNSWYIDMVIDDVINDLVAIKGYSRAAASLAVYTGGLRIYTAMDIEVQALLEEYYENEKNFLLDETGERPQSAMIVIDPLTGDILGVAGGVGEKTANRIQNFATQTVRPAGSVIKPLSVYAPALEEGIIDWATVYDDVPIKFSNYNSRNPKGVAWPKNANGIYRGLTNINYAISHSINTVTIKVLDDLGLDASFNFLYDKLYMKSLIPYGTTPDGSIVTDKDIAALALGQFNYGVTLRETTAAYSIFANEGIYNEYRSYIKVTDSQGKEILSNPYHGESVISEENASIMTLMLKNVLVGGTATDIALAKKIDVAGKTGTTQSNFDKWFIGYTPEYICGIWLGFEYPKTLDNSAGELCHKVWNKVMTTLNEENITSKKNISFSLSDNIIKATFCKDSGKLMTEACLSDPRGARSETGYFVKGDEPHQYCDVHLLVDYDTLYGGVACPYCPKENISSIGLINVKRSFPMQVYVTDAQYTWRDISTRILPSTVSELPFYSNLLKENEYSGISYGGKQYNRYCSEHFNYFAWKNENKE